VLPVVQRMEAQGHWLNAAKRGQIALISSLPLLMLILLGVAKVMVGLSRDKPVGLLVVLLIVTTVMMLVNVFTRPKCSRAAQTWLRNYQRQQQRLRTAPTQAEWHLAVAAFGFSALTGTVLADYAGLRQPVSGSDSGSSSSSSDSSSSDSGGGDSGGGGCGGCGGGGY
jgi:uncharacterized membrane protein YgcG